jgi:transposase
MVTDNQVRRLMKLINEEKTLAVAAAKAGMDEKTARKWRNLGKLPSETRPEHNWRTRKDPFEDVWEEIRRKLEINPGLEAKTLFEDLQRRYPGSFADGQLRTLQRKVKIWRALEGAAKEAFFPQEHVPGKLCESDFTHMTSLRVTIAGAPFPHLIYHFVLPYSNWETGTICFSECFESLSTGLQNALFELGAVPAEHRTDRLSTAVGKVKHPEEFTRRYRALLSHYGLTGKATNARSPNENGDVEQSHYRFKRAVDQALMLRGSRDFESRGDYAAFLKKIFSQLNAGRCVRFVSELKVLKTLPRRRLDT